MSDESTTSSGIYEFTLERLAYEMPHYMPLWGNPSNPIDITLPKACLSQYECTMWDTVQSVDIGRCSLHLPFDKISTPAQLLTQMSKLDNPPLKAADLYLMRSLINGLLNALPQERERYCKNRVCSDVKFEPLRSESKGWIAPNGHTICFDLAARFWHSRYKFKNVIGEPAWRCKGETARIEVCGNIRLDSDQKLQWITKHVNSSISKGSRCKTTIIDEVHKAIEEKVSGPANDISKELHNSLTSKLSFDNQQIASFLPGESGDYSTLRGLYEKATKGSKSRCSNPAPFPGNESVKGECEFPFLDAIGGLHLPKRCIETSGNSLQGACQLESILHRVETTPSGLELIIEDQPGYGYHHVIWDLRDALTNVLRLDISEEPMLSALYQGACIADSEADPYNHTTRSRTDERILRLIDNTIRSIHLKKSGMIPLGRPEPVNAN